MTRAILDQFWCFRDFWVDSDRGKRELYTLIDYWIPVTVELHCNWKLIDGRCIFIVLGLRNLGVVML